MLRIASQIFNGGNIAAKGGKCPPTSISKCTPSRTLVYLHAVFQVYFHFLCYLKFYSLVSWFFFLLTILHHLFQGA